MRSRNGWLLWLLAAACCIGQAWGAQRDLIVEDLLCRGNATTSCNFILSHLYLAPGDRLYEEEIQNAQLRLSSLPNFRSVHIYLEKGAERGQARVIVEVVEADPVAKELAAGALVLDSTLSQRFTGRLSHLNLLGGGEILDFTAQGTVAAGLGEGVSARLQYVEPRLFDTTRYFLSAGLSSLHDESRFNKGDFVKWQEFGIDAAVGRRFGAMSYVIVGYQQLAISDIEFRLTQPDGSVDAGTTSLDGRWIFSYGWNAEDDLYFPTRGSRFNLELAVDTIGKTKGDSLHLFVGYRRTWQSSPESVWTAQLGGTPASQYRRSALGTGLASGVGYARPLQAHDNFAGSKRGRWYVEAGLSRLDYTTTEGLLWALGAKAGVRFETKSFGIVDLHVIAGTDTRREEDK
jgi:outer membrane protein assembly factor BamA